MGKLMLFAVFILVLELVSGFSFSHSFTPDTPLTVYPGETKEIQIQLNANPDEGSLKIKAELLEGKEIASLIDSVAEYDVSSSSWTIVNIKLEIPENASNRYTIKVRFTDITPSKDLGTVSFKGGSVVTLPVTVLEKPKLEEEGLKKDEGKEIGWILFMIALTVGIVLMIYFIIRRRQYSSIKPMNIAR